MTRIPGSGLLKRIETSKRDFALRPEVSRVSKHVEQLLARFTVELRVVGQLFQHHHETRLRARLVHQIGHAVVEGVEVLAKVGRKKERFGNAFEHLLFGLGGGQVGVQKMLAHGLGGKQQVFLQAALDDASRLIPHAQFYPNQGLDAFLDCLRQAIAARGIPTRLYMDNAKIYRSPQLARIAASIGILIVHTPPYQPEGRGKIERFFRSVREQFLASLDPKVLLSLEQLNERLWHWLDTDYHRREHSSLQSTPLVRWQRDIEQVRQLPPATDLRRLFFHRVDRLVRRDSTFLLKNYFFEAPSHLAGKRIEVRFDPLDLTALEIYSEGKPQGRARLVDAVVNGLLPPWEREEK